MRNIDIKSFACSVLVLLICFEFPEYYRYMTAFLFILICLYKSTSGHYGISVIQPNMDTIICIGFIISYLFLESYFEASKFTKLITAFAQAMIFLAGYHLSALYQNHAKELKKPAFLSGVVALSYSVFIVITFFKTGLTNLVLYRNPINIWNGLPRQATHFGAMCMPIIGYAVWLLVIKKKTVPGIALLAFVAYFNLYTSSRTAIYMIAALIMVAILFRTKNEGWNKKFGTVFAISVLIIIGYTLFVNNVFGLRNYFDKTPLGMRYITRINQQEGPNTRFERQWYVITHFFDHMWGGGHYREKVFDVHNVFLEIYDYAGIVPFALYLIFTIQCLRAMIRINKWTNNNSEYLSVQLIIIAIIGQLLGEPVMQGTPGLFLILLLLEGYILGVKASMSKSNRGIQADKCLKS